MNRREFFRAVAGAAIGGVGASMAKPVSNPWGQANAVLYDVQCERVRLTKPIRLMAAAERAIYDQMLTIPHDPNACVVRMAYSSLSRSSSRSAQ